MHKYFIVNRNDRLVIRHELDCYGLERLQPWFGDINSAVEFLDGCLKDKIASGYVLSALQKTYSQVPMLDHEANLANAAPRPWPEVKGI